MGSSDQVGCIGEQIELGLNGKGVLRNDRSLPRAEVPKRS